MVRISVLQHAPSTHVPTRPGDPTPQSRNLNPLMHPFSRARERTRALNAAKMERIFAKPFVAALEGHVDAIECMAREPNSLTGIASGSWSGEIVLHNLSTRKITQKLAQAHQGKVSGLCYGLNGRLLSCGVDRTVKLWSVKKDGNSDESSAQPLTVYSGKYGFNAIDHHRTEPVFATASNVVQVWDENKTAPISSLPFPTTATTHTSLSFCPSSPSILASTASDRSLTLYDTRISHSSAELRTLLHLPPLCLSWSPILPTVLLTGSEDHNLYTFDVRKMNRPTQVYKAHTGAVTGCEWAPTGAEFVSGGWDRTLRIWKVRDVASGGAGGRTGVERPEVYHTKRMQRVTSVLFSPDARFVMSGSDDGNVRIWKAHAAEKLGVVTARERAAIEYRAKLRERWAVDSEVARVARTRHLPKSVRSEEKLRQTRLEARRVKEERRRKHTRAGETKPKPEKDKVVLAQQT